MRYYGESNVPGAPGNFRTMEYAPARDGIPAFEPMPYYGGGMGVEPMAALPEPMSQESFAHLVDSRRLDRNLKQMGYDSLIQYLRDTNQLPPIVGGGRNLGV